MGGNVSGESWQPRKQHLLRQLQAQGITSPHVLAALERVDRHRFVPAELQERAYDNVALPIGQEQTISQPYVVALMTELAQVTADDRVLVVGTGSGYQDAVLAELVQTVFSVERISSMADVAAARLQGLGYRNVRVRVSDGSGGWPEEAPFAAVLVTAATAQVPSPLLAQLAPGGRLVIPVGPPHQQVLRVIKRLAGGLEQHDVVAVQFVPLLPGTAAHI